MRHIVHFTVNSLRCDISFDLIRPFLFVRVGRTVVDLFRRQHHRFQDGFFPLLDFVERMPLSDAEVQELRLSCEYIHAFERTS